MDYPFLDKLGLLAFDVICDFNTTTLISGVSEGKELMMAFRFSCDVKLDSFWLMN